MPLDACCYDGEPVADLPASLDGMYLSGAGRGAYWPAGDVSDADAGRHEIDGRGRRAERARRTRSAPSAASGSATSPPTSDAARGPCRSRDACGRYVDHFELERAGQGG